MKKRHAADQLISDIKRRKHEPCWSITPTSNQKRLTTKNNRSNLIYSGTQTSRAKSKHTAMQPRVQQIDQDTYTIAVIQDEDEAKNCSHCSNKNNRQKQDRHQQLSQKVYHRPQPDSINIIPIAQLKPTRHSSSIKDTMKESKQVMESMEFSITRNVSKAFISVSGSQMKVFLNILDEPLVKKFLKYDICLRVSDKYLIAMAFAYFARSGYQPHEYTQLNFFVALYLAHDVEEDEEDYKYEIFPWALGKMWRVRYKSLLCMRDALWKRMDYKAIVSRRCCEEIFAIEPNHPVWKRNRNENHAGAIRPWLKDANDDGRLIGPDGSPRHCKHCEPRLVDSDHDSLSPNSDCVWLKLDSSCSSLEEYTAQTDADSFNVAGFNMNELQQTLQCSSTRTNSSGKGISLLSGDVTLDWVDCHSCDSDNENIAHQPEA